MQPFKLETKQTKSFLQQKTCCIKTENKAALNFCFGQPLFLCKKL